MKRIVVLIFSVLFVAGAFAQDEANDPGANKRIPNLTQEQKQEIRNIRQKFRDDTRQLREKEYNLRKEYFDILKQDNPDMNRIKQITAEMAQVRAQIDFQAAQMHKRIMEQLNEEQKQWYRENRLKVKKPPVTPKPKVDKSGGNKQKGNKGNK